MQQYFSLTESVGVMVTIPFYVLFAIKNAKHAGWYVLVVHRVDRVQAPVTIVLVGHEAVA